MRTLKILPEVAVDLAEAARWYDEKGYEGLGSRLIDSFYATLPLLLDRGEIHLSVYGEFHRVLLRPFPYFVFYRFTASCW